MREICFDTETTGFNPQTGDRLVEIGAVEIINKKRTGVIFHKYINPERDVPEAAVNVHGLTNEFLADKPIFSEIAQEWIDFVGDSSLVAHNAIDFDMKFINYELEKAGYEKFATDKFIDTLIMARNMFPGARNSLDALCKRYNIDNSARTVHGALLDAELLADVYLQMSGGDEPSINFSATEKNINISQKVVFGNQNILIPRNFSVSEEQEKEHIEFMKNSLKSAIWLSETEKND